MQSKTLEIAVVAVTAAEDSRTVGGVAGKRDCVHTIFAGDLLAEFEIFADDEISENLRVRFGEVRKKFSSSEPGMPA